MISRFPKSFVCLQAALLACLCASSTTAQNGTNYRIFSNRLDTIYAGIGAGAGAIPGVDGLGLHISGEDIRGNTLTTLGDFGYREAGWRESICVFGAPSASLAIDFPLLVTIEFDGVGVFSPEAVFSFPVCGTAGSFPLGNSAGFAPYGGPTSGSFVILGLPSNAGLPTSTSLLVPNEGLIGGPTTATITSIAAAAASLPLASTGFCWTVQFTWLPSALVSLEDIDSWYTWRSNGRGGALGNQYWGMSNDELGTWQSQTVATTGGLGMVTQFFANLNYEYYSLSVNPTIQDALLPAGFNGSGAYYSVGAGVPNSGSSVNGGFDVGMHQGISLSGTGGVPNPITGFANQDPSGSPTAGLTPTLGFLSWNNSPGPSVRYRLTWVSIFLELSFGIDPAATSNATFAFGTVRAPNLISVIPGPFPQPDTLAFFPLLIHSMDFAAAAQWPSPSGSGFGGGTFGIPNVAGATAHLPTLGSSSVCIGFPVGLQYGSSAMGSPSGPLLWSRNGSNAPSNSGVLPLID